MDFISRNIYDGKMMSEDIRRYALGCRLIDAAEEGDMSRCKELVLKYNVPVNFKSDFGETPLIAAALKGNVEIGRFFLENGARVDDTNLAGFTAFIYSLLEEKMEFASMLLENGYDINIKTQIRDINEFVLGEATPLYVMAKYLVEDSLVWLLDHGAKCNIKCINGETAIFPALRCCSVKMVQALIDKGASVLIKNAYGETPLNVLEKIVNDTRFSPNARSAYREIMIIIKDAEYMEMKRNISKIAEQIIRKK
jgi:ankyrin repeat protein